jgi:two-component sensor histidine kinase
MGGFVTGTTTLELPRRAGSAGIARLIMTAHGSSLGSEQLKNANVMISELVSNAFKHGKGLIELTVESGPDGVWACVRDEGSGVIATPDPRPARGGWGLYFVERLADQWGVAEDDSRVWFRVGDVTAAA